MKEKRVNNKPYLEPDGAVLAFSGKLLMERVGKDFIMAYVFHDREEMRRWARLRVNGASRGSFRDAEAMAHSWEVFPNGGARNNDCGWVAFHVGQKGVGVVAHEMAHAAAYYLNRRRFKPTSRSYDEKNAWTVGWLCHQFVEKANRAGLYK